MGRFGRGWTYRIAGLLGCGLLVLMLLPGSGTTPDQAGQAPSPVVATVSKSAAAPRTPPSTPRVIDTAMAAPTPQAPVTVAPASLPPTASPSPWWTPYRVAPAFNSVAATNSTASPPGASGRVGEVPVNGRAAPSLASDKRFVLAAGETVEVAETQGGWTHVHRANGDDGWVATRYLAQSGSGAGKPPSPAMATRATRRGPENLVAAGRRAPWETQVFAAPDASAEPLFFLQPGDRVRIAGERGNWLLVVTPDGMSGWIPS